jgi:hypothetical protein
MYLPPDDRRHFVAWSERTPADFRAGFWSDFWDWYNEGGLWHVVAYLRQCAISSFKPGEPPPKTEAFWDIVNANRPADETALDEVLDLMMRPDVVTIKQVSDHPGAPFELAEWLRDRKHRRIIPRHFGDCGYVTVHNPDAANRGRWRIGGRKVVIFGRKDLPQRELLAAARKLAEEQ